MLFIKTKHNMQTVGVITFIKLQNDKQQLNGENWDVELGHLSACVELCCFHVQCWEESVKLSLEESIKILPSTWHESNTARP